MFGPGSTGPYGSYAYGWGRPDIHRTAYAIMMVADTLAFNGRQAISNHHADLTVTTHNIYIACIIDGLVQERRKSIAGALELRLTCTYPSICS